MPEKAISTEDLPVPKKARMTCGFTVWCDYPTLKDLDIVAAYEHMDRGPLVRMVLVDKIRCYKRNPAFKRFLVQLRQAEEEKKSKRGGRASD
jgi:hypothetical protein